MQINGQYVGLGLGDSSDEVAKFKAWAKKKFTPARNTLDDGPLFTEDLRVEVAREQSIYAAQGKLTDPYIPGVINLATKYAVGYLSREVILPLMFTVEGHMSDMWVGPVAYCGEVLRAEGRALHFPTWYDRTTVPFKNQTGVAELARRLGQTVQDNGVKFPPGTPWVGGAFSQGSMVWCDFYRQFLMPGKPLNWRLPDLRAAVVCGNPDREKGVVAEWIPDPPAADREGIMGTGIPLGNMVDTPEWWKEVARHGDMYTDNESTGEVGQNKTAIARIITQGSFSGGVTGFLSRAQDILMSPMDDIIPVAMSVWEAFSFVIDMTPHGGYDMEPAVQFLRDRLAA